MESRLAMADEFCSPTAQEAIQFLSRANCEVYRAGPEGGPGGGRVVRWLRGYLLGHSCALVFDRSRADREDGGLIRPCCCDRLKFMPLTLVLNGQSRTFETLSSGSSLQQLVETLELKGDRVAVERNGEIAPRTRWGAVGVADGDRIEVVHFVGGGC